MTTSSVGSRYGQTQVTNVTTDVAVSGNPGVYKGFSLRETAGAAAVVRIFDAASATGTVLDEIAFDANESVREYYDPGIPARTAIWFEVVSGAVTGSIRWA